MPLHDFKCNSESCGYEFEELHKEDELIICPLCDSEAHKLCIGKLADYSGLATMRVQYTTRNSPIKDSHIQKPDFRDPVYLKNKIRTEKV